MENPASAVNPEGSLRKEIERLRKRVAELEQSSAHAPVFQTVHPAVLETSSEMLLAIFGQAPVGMAVLEGPNHVFSLANPKYLSSLFGGRQDFVGKTVSAAVPEAVEQGFVALLDRVYQTGEPFIGTETPIELFQAGGGSKKFFLNFIYQPLRDADQKIRGILGVVQDVTEQVVNRAKAEENERKIRALIETLPQLVWTCTADGECDYLSPQWTGYTGAPTPEISKLAWVASVIHPDDRARVWAHWEGAISGKHSYDIEYRIRRQDGEFRWFKTRAVPIKNQDGSIRSWFGTCTDIHETKEVESKLAMERSLLETVFEQSPAAMVLWKGPDLIFDKINPGYQAIFTDRELLGKPFSEALPETKGQPFEQWIKHVFETGESKIQPEMLARLVLHRGGPIEDRYFDMSFVQVKGVDDQPYGVYEHAVDVTERVLSRRALEKSKAEIETTVSSLEKEREIRERFVATLTHDLRTPLTAAKMSAQLMQRKLFENEALQKLAMKITDNLDHADVMIRDLLDANLIRAGEKLPIQVTPCNLRQLVAEAIDNLGTVYGDRFVLHAEQDIQGSWSPSGIRRILENLCGNAIKYGASQRPVLISLISAGGWVKIAVRNEGAVIPVQEQKNLFAPFHRATSAKTGEQKGWGLGLTLVRGLAEAHGGDVGVTSSENQGTTFTVSLPLATGA